MSALYMIIPISSSYGCDLRYITARVAHPSLCIRKQKGALHLPLLPTPMLVHLKVNPAVCHQGPVSLEFPSHFRL